MALEQLFPVPSAAAIVRSADAVAEFAEEESAIAGATIARQREFLGGRNAARRALLALGAPAVPLLPDRDRVPRWPAGYIGSISHCATACAAVAVRRVHARSVGLDVEPNVALPCGIERLILSPWEFVRLPYHCTGIADCRKLAFVAKEAFYKCFFPVCRTFLEFRDVRLCWGLSDECSGNFRAELIKRDRVACGVAKRIVGRWLLDLDLGLIWAGATLV